MGNTMHTLIRAAALALTFQQAASLTATLAAQGAGGAARPPNPACALVAEKEVEAATGLDYGPGEDFDELYEGVGGKATCVWGGPSLMGEDLPEIGVLFFPASARGSNTEARAKRKLRAGCTREPVRGVGDRAFVEICSRVHLERGRLRQDGKERHRRAGVPEAGRVHGLPGQAGCDRARQGCGGTGEGQVSDQRGARMSWLLRCLAAGVVAALAGCDGDQAEAELRVPRGEGRPRSGAMPEETATQPASPCDWIPASEVEAVVGKLSGAPRKHEGGCFYPLPLDSITIARRAKAEQVREALERAGMKSDWPAEPEDTGGVFIQVTVGVGAEERPAELGFATLGSWVGNDSLHGGGSARRRLGLPPQSPRQAKLLGPRRHDHTWWWRAGRTGWTTTCWRRWPAGCATASPTFPSWIPTRRPGCRTGPDPCSVLSRDEAEVVLGPLVVAPYRVREGGALADPAAGAARTTPASTARSCSPRTSRTARARCASSGRGAGWDWRGWWTAPPTRRTRSKDPGMRSRSASTASSRCSRATGCWRSPSSHPPPTSAARSGSPDLRCQGWRPRDDRCRRLARRHAADIGARRPRALLRGAGSEPARRLATHRARRARRGADGRAHERGDLAARLRRCNHPQRPGEPGRSRRPTCSTSWPTSTDSRARVRCRTPCWPCSWWPGWWSPARSSCCWRGSARAPCSSAPASRVSCAHSAPANRTRVTWKSGSSRTWSRRWPSRRACGRPGSGFSTAPRPTPARSAPGRTTPR